MIFGPLFMILVVAAVIAAVLLFVRSVGGPWHGALSPHQGPPGRTPLDILKERFARGDIDKQEFEERRRALGE
jgi:putative membrane protein